MIAIKAIGFDLFNTLMTVHPQAMKEAHQKLFNALLQQGIEVDAVPFTQAYVEAAKHFVEEAHREGRETHNRFWIAEALKSQGYEISPDDSRIAISPLVTLPPPMAPASAWPTAM